MTYLTFPARYFILYFSWIQSQSAKRLKLSSNTVFLMKCMNRTAFLRKIYREHKSMRNCKHTTYNNNTIIETNPFSFVPTTNYLACQCAFQLQNLLFPCFCHIPPPQRLFDHFQSPFRPNFLLP